MAPVAVLRGVLRDCGATPRPVGAVNARCSLSRATSRNRLCHWLVRQGALLEIRIVSRDTTPVTEQDLSELPEPMARFFDVDGVEFE